MKRLFIRDKKVRQSFLRKESVRRALRFLYYNQRLDMQVRWRVGLLLKELPKQSHVIKSKNRCVHTGRSGSIIRDFRLSRITFRDRVAFGQLLGVVKKSW